MKMNTQRLLMSLSMVALFAACSRPVAYFQPIAREHFATTPAKTEVNNPVDASVPMVAEAIAPVAATSNAQLAQANTTLDQVDAIVRNDSKLVADKTVQKRLSRIKAFVAETSAKSALTTNSTVASKKMNLLERLVVKKMNKKISKQLAPNNPEKAMANRGLLVGGLVLALVGLLLAILGSGTTVTVGVIVLLLGAVALVLGLIAS